MKTCLNKWDCYKSNTFQKLFLFKSLRTKTRTFKCDCYKSNTFQKLFFFSKTCMKTCPYIAEPTLSEAELPLILALITTAPNGD